MKKLGILMMVLLLVGGFAFAQEATITGSATLTFGVDLDDPVAMGFKNEASSTVSLTLASGSDSKGAQGVIELSSFAIKIDSTDELTITAPSVTGKLVFAPITVKIYSAPSFSGSNAAGFSYAGADADDLVKAALANKNTSAAAGTALPDDGTIVVVEPTETAPTTGVFIDTDADGNSYYAVPGSADGATTASYQGVTVMVDVAPLTVSLLLASDGTWANAPRTEDNINDFAFGATVSAAVAPLNVNAGVFAGPTDGLDLGVTFGADAAVGPATVDFGIDGFLPEGGEFSLDGSLVVGATFGPATLGTNTYFWTSPDFDLDQQVSLDLSGAVEGLGFTETFQIIDVLSGAAAWNSKTAVSYATGGIKPYATFIYYSSSQIDLTAGVELTGFVENTTFTLQYDVDDIENDNGAVTFATKIAY